VNTTATTADRFIAHGCRLCRRLFDLCATSASTAAPPLAAALAPLAGKFAWHAELLYDVLPVRVDIDRDALVEEGIDRADDAMDQLDEIVASDDSLALARALCYVVDWFAARVTLERASTDPRLEGPRARALTLLARDLDDACVELESLRSRLAVDPGSKDDAPSAERVAAALATAEAASLRMEGLTAPVE
jgi:hypothetical protein